MATPSDGSAAIPLRPALRTDGDDGASPKCGPAKVVSIAEPEELSPLSPLEDGGKIKQFNAGVAKRMTGRPFMHSNSSSRQSFASQSSMDDYNVSPEASTTPNRAEKKHHQHHEHHHDKLLTQVAEWLQAEKAKRAAQRAGKRSSIEFDPATANQHADGAYSRTRTSSQSSDSSALSLEKLQRILEDNMNSFGHEQLPVPSPSIEPRRLSYAAASRRRRRSRGFASSDTEYQDGDVIVPSCDVVLDNSKTLSYSAGAVESSAETVTQSSPRAEKERKAWFAFKSEIVRLAHTLRLKGWRRVPLERGGEIEVERLSGALTNAVYVVSPPKELPPLPSASTSSLPQLKSVKAQGVKPPPKLLLRIYGPQVEHLIDREKELGILRRLARKKIGPRLLGTFKNGRFEEFFNAQTLTWADMRVPDTSKQIAKRMRELHEGVELLEREREEGPFIWRNWDKWVDRCEVVISYLDRQVISGGEEGADWWERGLVCGVEWTMFKATIDKYRRWLDKYYAGKGGVRRNLVFAHNDTQYGNILRLIPETIAGSAPSPLLLPANEHKQLVVIDFEYASANTPGLEFANHFTEWCYNYHDSARPWACNTNNYPTLEEQRRFVRSYINHRPQFNPQASATPKLDGKDGITSGGAGSISAFMLDSRTPGGATPGGGGGETYYVEEEARRERELSRQVEELLEEVRIWRVANSAQWVAWGIVQAKVPGLDSSSEEEQSPPSSSGTEKPTLSSDSLTPEHQALREGKEHDKRPEGLLSETLSQGHTAKEAEQLEDAEDEFDYLRYAQERAMFFWGDVLGLGLVKEAELPESLLKRLKIVGS